tara:strand:- start:109 stop:225 length:117 start_codon:yes stop_codon:yes gene_type:complete
MFNKCIEEKQEAGRKKGRKKEKAKHSPRSWVGEKDSAN